MSESLPCVLLSSGLRMIGWVQDFAPARPIEPATGPPSELVAVPAAAEAPRQLANFKLRLQTFHIIFERVEPDISTNTEVGASSSCSSAASTQSDQSQETKVAKFDVSRTGWLVQGTITFGESQPPHTQSNVPLSTRFTGTADLMTGAFNIVTDGVAGVHCESECRYMARQSRLGAQTLRVTDSSESPSSVESERSLLLGFWAATDHNTLNSGAFFIHRLQQRDDSINWSLPVWTGATLSSLPLPPEAVVSLPDRMSLPYSSLWYFGLVEHMGKMHPMTFLADVQPALDEVNSYTIEGVIRVYTGGRVQHFVANGRCTSKGRFQLRVKRPKGSPAVTILKTHLVPIEGEWNAQCELDAADDSHALMALGSFQKQYRFDFEHVAVNGWTSDILPRQLITANLQKSDAKRRVQPATRFHLYSLPRRIPRHYLEDSRSEGPRDEIGRAHGYEHRRIEKLGDVSVVYEYNHGMIIAAKMYSRVHTYPLQTYDSMTPLRFTPTSTPGVMIAVRGREMKDRNHLELIPTIKPWKAWGMSGKMPKLSKGHWMFCGMSNDYKDADGVLVPLQRPLDVCAPVTDNSPRALHFKQPFALLREQISSCTGELWMGRFDFGRPIGEHKVRTANGEWWLLTMSQPGVIADTRKVPLAQNEEFLVSARNAITALQERLRDHRLKADEHLRIFDERAKNSPLFQSLNIAPVPMAAVCRSLDLPATRHIISAGNTEVAFDCCLIRSDEPGLSHLREIPHGFGMMFDTSAPDCEIDPHAGLPRGSLLYEGEFQFGQMHGFGHRLAPSRLRGGCIHTLGQFQFGVDAGKAMWILHTMQAPVRTKSDPLPQVAQDAAQSQLQQLVVTPGDTNRKG